jgi:glutaredoxin
MLKNLLKYNGLEFENIDISRNEKAKQEMIEISGQSEITPVMSVDGIIFIGFDREKIKEVLNI